MKLEAPIPPDMRNPSRPGSSALLAAAEIGFAICNSISILDDEAPAELDVPGSGVVSLDAIFEKSNLAVVIPCFLMMSSSSRCSVC